MNGISQSQFRNWFQTHIGVRLAEEDDEDPILIEPFSDITGIQDSPSSTEVHDFFDDNASFEDEREVRPVAPHDAVQ